MVQDLGKDTTEQERSNGNGVHKEEKRAGDNFEEITGQTDGLDQEFGRLVVGEGKSRYVASGLWASISEQVEDIKDILSESSDEDDHLPSESGHLHSLHDHDGFLFSFNSLALDLRGLHPDLSRISFCWQTFKDRVDPMIKMVHIPTTERFITEAKDNLDSLPKGVEALLFAIYYAAVTSLTQQECQDAFGESRHMLLAKYRFCVEQALARANFLSAQELCLLQTFVIFLICVRRYDETRFVWTLTGLAIRIAQALGLHRDGTSFNLSPFETEMRRRVWWNICVLDLRTAEDHGSDPTITEPGYDTKLPLNIDDTEISPDSNHHPEDRSGCTEMTFCLLRFEVSTTMRRLDYIPPGASTCRNIAASFSLHDKEKSIEDCHRRLEEKYLQYCDKTVPLYWVTATVARLTMAKMWLVLYHPFQRPGSRVELPQHTKDRLFVTSIEVLEYARLIETERSTTKWGWMFRSYTQWHSTAYLLAELCHRTKGEVVDRAWNAVNGVLGDWGEQDSSTRKGMLWGPLRKLMAKAKRAREAEEAREWATASYNVDASVPIDPSVVVNTGEAASASGDAALDLLATQVTVSDQAHAQTAFGPAGVSDSQPDYQWMLNDTNFDIDTEGEGVNWAGWDNLVKDYTMQLDQQDPDQPGPVLGGMASWW
ncbi:MAG: hypothetical protein M1816_001026 [Peltula sp. TS41687]|nr:MAG: hypothetical protein M1816_001026 [Peltula sp. TS41687]